MRKLTLSEFKEYVLEDQQGLYGLTDEEIEIYYFYYIFGRKSVSA